MSHHHHSHEGHSHGITSGQPDLVRRIYIAIVLNILITVLELAFGIYSSSYALIADSFHNFSDVLALVLTLIGIHLYKKSNTPHKTFGFKRAELMVGFINSFVLIIIGASIIKESAFYLFNPREITGWPVIVFSGLSVILNILCVIILETGKKDKSEQHSVSVKSSILHLLTDALTSVAVCIGGILIYYRQLYWVDSIISVFIGGYVILGSLSLVKYSMKMLMNFTPTHINIEELSREVNTIEEVKNIHHIHLWNLSEKDLYLEAHITLNQNLTLEDTSDIRHRLEHLLEDKFQITHTTLQFEFEPNCADVLIEQH